MTIRHTKESGRGATIRTVFSHEDIHPFDATRWTRRRAEIRDEAGKVIWEQDDIEVPEGWSQLATNVVASKYFYGDPRQRLLDGRPEREVSVRQLMHRVCDAIAVVGEQGDYFATPEDVATYRRELVALCLGQYGAFNSPVWFNLGLHHEYGIRGPANNWAWDHDTRKALPCEDAYMRPQISACFIQSVRDDMAGIMELAASEAMLFKYGSGTGTDLSTLRSSREHVSGGGRASGPVSFMRIYDAIASVIKSGGKTRRAAKIQTLKCMHPDILEFIDCKAKEDRKARALIREGYADGMTGHPDEAYSSVMFQNSNLSVRVTDAFLRQATGKESGPWCTRAVTTGEVIGHHDAGSILDRIAEGTWACGDPGLQYEDTIQRWHTCPNTARINSSNPCSEYMFIDDSACNLASLNLLKFRREDGTIDDDRLRAAVRIFITAQEILVDHASYPTALIAENSHKFRPLGLGFCNLGALLMACGLPYDSDEGRALASLATALLHGQAYLTSAQLAAHLGPFEGYEVNRDAMMRVIGMHRDAANTIDSRGVPELERLKLLATRLWADVIDVGEEHGFRNSQVTVIAPTGTIAFMMDADTTGVEPCIALVSYKNLAGGGQLKIVNRTVPLALATLGYGRDDVATIMAYMEEHDTIEGCPRLDDAHLPVFDCAFRPFNGRRAIRWEGHVYMMAAIQPFVSGALSKTVNMDCGATPADIRHAYIMGWQLGLKSLAVFRDGSKGAQPVRTSRRRDDADDPARETEEGRTLLSVTGHLATFLGRTPDLHEVEDAMMTLISLARKADQPVRRRLPALREALNHRFEIRAAAGTVEGYVNVGFHPGGCRQPGEIFVRMSKQGSTVSGLMDVIATLVSITLQYGVPLDILVKKFAHTRFEPSGLTDNPDIPVARSVTDYIFRWLGMEFIPGYREENAPRRERPAERTYANVNVQAPGTVFSARHAPKVVSGPHDGGAAVGEVVLAAQLTGPECERCGSIMVPAGPCYRCMGCGNDAGGCG